MEKAALAARLCEFDELEVKLLLGLNQTQTGDDISCSCQFLFQLSAGRV